MTHQSTDQNTPYHGITKPAFEKDPWDHDYYEFVDAVDSDLKLSGTIANRPTAANAPTDAWYEATDQNLIYRNDATNGWVVIGYGNESNPIPEAYFTDLKSGHVWFGQQTSAPSNSEIGNGNVAIYAKDDGEIYRKPYGEPEGIVGVGGRRQSISTPGTELETGFAISHGVPVPDGGELSVVSWGVRTSEGTTPVGLLAQLTQVNGTLIGESNTGYSNSVTLSVSNTSGSLKWYNFRIKNETGTNYVEGSTPDSVYGSFVYDVII